LLWGRGGWVRQRVVGPCYTQLLKTKKKANKIATNRNSKQEGSSVNTNASQDMNHRSTLRFTFKNTNCLISDTRILTTTPPQNPRRNRTKCQTPRRATDIHHGSGPELIIVSLIVRVIAVSETKLQEILEYCYPIGDTLHIPTLT